MQYRKNTGEEKNVIWIEKIGLIITVKLQVLGFFSNTIVRYNEHHISFLCKKYFRLLRKTDICKNFNPANLSLDKKDSKGYALSYKVHKSIDICVEKFCQQYISNKPEWFKKMTKTYLAFSLLSRITFITMVESEIEEKLDQKNVLYLFRHPLNSTFIPFYTKKGLTIKESYNLIEHIRFFLKPLKVIFAILLSKITSYKIKTNISKINPAIWVEHVHKEVVDFTFWKYFIKTKDVDIVCYLDRKDTPPVSEITSEIEKDGLKWIDAQRFSLIKASNFSLSDLKESIKILFVSSNLPNWFKTFRFEENVLFLLYKSVFKRFQVKILIQHQDTSWQQATQAMAIESVGGIMIGFHWSNFVLIVSQHLTPQHVYFVWGKIYFDWIQQKSNTCRYILPSGLWITIDDGRLENLNNLSKEVKFKLCIFDSSVEYYLHQTPHSLSKFYLKIIKLLENNTSWCGIVKSKNWRNIDDLVFLPKGNEIVSRMNLLVNQNRLFVLDKTTSPVTAASYANLSVGYGLNSAVIVSAIHGYRGVHWDCSGWLKHPFYKDPTQKFIYQSLNELEEAIISASKGDKSIGDFSKWRQKLNYFDDLNAPERIGKFIQDFMDEVIKTDDGKHSMDFAVKKYIEENGIKDDFFKMDNLWENE